MTLSDHLVRFDGAMFVGDELQLGVGFDAARGGLANLARRGLLTSASAEAYGEGLTAVVRVAPRDSGPGASKLVKVHPGPGDAR